MYMNTTQQPSSSRLTQAQFRAMSTVLAEGGLWDGDLHMGRLRGRPGTERKTMIATLVRLGFVRSEAVEDPDRQCFAGSPDTWVGRATLGVKYFATAAGCAAWRAYDDAERFRQLTQLDEVRS